MAPAAQLTPEQDSLRWRAVMQRIADLERQLAQTVKYGNASAPGGSIIAAQTVVAGSVQIGAIGSATGQQFVLSAFSDGTITAPYIQAKSPSFQVYLSPQLGIYDNRDATAAAVILCDEQQAYDAGLNLRTYSEISLFQGSSMRVDGFNTLSYPGGLGPGVAGSWATDFSFPWRYHSAPSSITTVSVVADSLNGGTKSIVDIDYFGATLQIAGAAGGGYTLNRWTASGGN
jgi:hypothetical protein